MLLLRTAIEKWDMPQNSKEDLKINNCTWPQRGIDSGGTCERRTRKSIQGDKLNIDSFGLLEEGTRPAYLIGKIRVVILVSRPKYNSLKQ